MVKHSNVASSRKITHPVLGEYADWKTLETLGARNSKKQRMSEHLTMRLGLSSY
jgi:hypothetical protein